MKRLHDTYIFKSAESKVKFMDNVRKVDLDKDRIKPEELEDDLKIIKRRFLFSLKTKVIDAVMSGKIIMIFPEYAELSKLVPIYLTKNPANNEVVAVVNIRLYSTRDKLGNINIEKRRLYALLECAYIERELYLQQSKMLMSSRLYTLSSKVYVKLVNKIFDKKFSVNLMPLKSDQLNFILAKFFLLYVLEKPNNELVENVAYSSIFNDTPKQQLVNFASDFEEGDFQSLPAFVDALKNNFDFLSDKLSVRTLLFEFMNMYGDASIYTLEYYPSLLETCFNGAIFGSRIVKDQIIDSVAGKEIADLHTEVSRLLV